MTRNEGLLSLRGIVTAAVLTIAGALLAALCFRVAIVEALPPASPSVSQFAPHAPDVVLDKAATALIVQHGILGARTLEAVRRAAAAAPLDARAFLVLGHQQLLDGKPAQAVATLEAGQRLDPRNRVIHVLLLDRYLRDRRYADAATQFSISARLVGEADAVIAEAMAQMSLAPETRDAVRRTLGTDPLLEKQVLAALARSDAAPAAIFALASPRALRDAGGAQSWGSVLVGRLIGQGHYAEARAIWQRLYRLSDSTVAAPLFDAGLSGLPGGPPFNWTLVTSGLGAADMRGGTLAIDYYGRDTGLLAEQLLVLKPGAYRFAFSVEGSRVGAGPALAWTLRCTVSKGDGGAELMSAVVAATGAPHRESASFTVPANCPAQRLALVGNAGEFPVPMNVTLRDLALQATAHP